MREFIFIFYFCENEESGRNEKPREWRRREGNGGRRKNEREKKVVDQPSATLRVVA